MAAVTSIIAAAAVGLAGASAVSQNAAAKKQRKAQKNALAQQETEAREANKLSQTRTDTGADVAFGTQKASDDLLRRGKRKTGSGSKSANNTVGGL